MVRKLTPVMLLVCALSLSLLAVTMMTALSLRQHWLGVKFSPDPERGFVIVEAVEPDGPGAELTVGAPVLAIADVALEAGDLVEEPDVAESYIALRRFFSRQSELYGAISKPLVLVQTAGDASASVEIRPASSRPITSLPPVYWVQIATGVFSALIGTWIWSLRRNELSARLLAVAGAGIMIAAFPAAVYSSREIALEADVFRLLSVTNYFGTLIFGIAILALLLVYPQPVAQMRSLWLLPAVFIVIWIIDTAGLGVPGPAYGRHLPAVLLMIGILLAAFLQYRLCVDDPVASAAIRWFGLSVCLCAGSFVAMVLLPNLFGWQASISQGYAFVLFGILFAGVAVGVARYRLFELESWAFSILTYFGAVVTLITVDATLIAVIALDRPAAFALSLILVALVYLPCRDWIAKRLTKRQDIDREDLFSQIVDIAMSGEALRQDRWKETLRRVFNPLQISQAAEGPELEPTIASDGVELVLPAMPDLPALKLSHASMGRRLFTPRDKRFAAEISAMLRHAIHSRNAQETGATQERLRIARDMHDNMGAQLLSALHSETVEKKDTLIRQTISDLRDIVNNAARGGKTLSELLADLKNESAERLAAAGIELVWQEADLDDQIVLSPNAAYSLRSICRELVSNTIRHSGATTMWLRCELGDHNLEFCATDDGRGIDADLIDAGNGLANIEARLLALEGRLALSNLKQGLKVRACFPVQASLER